MTAEAKVEGMRQTANPSDDLFLSLAMDAPDKVPVPLRKPLNVRERAPSNESLNASRLAELRAQHSPSPAQTADHGQRTPSLRASMRKPRYAIGTTTSSSFEAAAREWNASPDVLKFPSKRPTGPISDAIPRQRRMYRVGKAYEPLTTSRNLSSLSDRLAQGLITPTMSPAPTARKGSNAESESVDSVNAPSTVWDELDDLKSRIRSLEIGGKQSPSAANVTNHSFERPRTATTAPTTISSSPKHARKQSSVPADANTPGLSTANIHPLLHSALGKAKNVLSTQLYRSLEATATDALALAAMTGSGGPQGTAFTAASMVNGATVSDRHIRRKADSMCRNLTDLCIALCEGRSDLASPATKVSPMDVSHMQSETPSSRYARRASLGPQDLQLRTEPTRSMSRLDNRRSSLLGLGLGNTISTSPLEAHDPYLGQELSPGHDQTDYAARYNRPGTSMQNSGHSQAEDEAPLEVPSRAPSRAMTELGHMRQSSTRRTDYGSGVQHSPSLRETLAARRANAVMPAEGSQYGSTSSHSEATRRILERRAAMQLEESQYVPKRRRIASLTQYSPLSPRIGSEPVRTSSLSRRRNLVVE
ncbi:hypothetical protein E4T38_08260 [Aureobasidium subglaciale]|nr:hypothetical protein E4T38_08260 [Aureobasidium subglaciale]KAI5215693.1 hypothetical protein E4T40_08270 [Aureobasidium subglaciale]KAI5218880.1 hypothetical protein E4T41_08185 [Aureobasidium subglaciale]KAI5256558.1 hypothetical protein E4T46_08161 [Aureobasidium subglaciale]